MSMGYSNTKYLIYKGLFHHSYSLPNTWWSGRAVQVAQVLCHHAIAQYMAFDWLNYLIQLIYGFQIHSSTLFIYFNTDFQLETYVQESSCLEWIHAISNLTGSVLYCCWAACESWRKMRERTWYDVLTYIASKQRMCERTLRCANERFPVATNEHRLLASLRYHLWISIDICFSLRIVLD